MKPKREQQTCTKCGGRSFTIESVVPDPRNAPGASVAVISCEGGGCGVEVAGVGRMSIGQHWRGLRGVK